jgi:LAO/AO transport system kinase
VKTVASKGEGSDEVIAALQSHRDWLENSGDLGRRRQARAADEIEALAVAMLRDRMGDLRGGTALERLAGQVAAGQLDPYAAADELVAGITS